MCIRDRSAPSRWPSRACQRELACAPVLPRRQGVGDEGRASAPGAPARASSPRCPRADLRALPP
eukprot:9045839-Alexandrium_andersonii.AAC.1